MERRSTHIGQEEQDGRKSLLVKIGNHPISHPRVQEGLRCARGLAADGRWKVTLVLSEEVVMSSKKSTEFAHVSDLAAIQDLSASVDLIVVARQSGQDFMVPEERMQIVSPDAALRRGLAADVVLLF